MNLATPQSKQISASDTVGLEPLRVLKTRVARSGLAMIVRQLLTKPMGFVANIVLARLLIPEQFGLYSIVSTSVSLFSIFGDAGLAPALIRLEHQPTAEEEDSIFTLQQMVVGLPLLLLVLAAPLIVDMFHLGHQNDWLVRLVALSGFITTFRVIPSVRLRRRLQLDTIANIEIFESLGFNVVVMTLAFMKCGVWSFAIASLLSQIGGVLMTFAAEPWTVRWRINWGTCRNALKFGVKYQLISIVNCIHHSFLNMWIGLICGATALGFFTFAYTTAQYPFIIGSAFTGLYLPLFSQVQGDKLALARACELAVRTNNVLIFGLASVLIPTAPLVVAHVFGANWLPAVHQIYFLLIPVFFFGTNTPIMGLCHAVGRPDIPLRYTCWLVAGSTITFMPLVYALGPIGFGMAQPLLLLFNFALYRETVKIVPVRLAAQILPPLAAAALNACVTAIVLQHVHVNNVFGLAGVCVCSFAFFSVVVNLFVKNQLWHQLIDLTRVIFCKTEVRSSSG